MKLHFMTFFTLLLLSQISFAQKLILLHTNDHHGHFMQAETGDFGLAAQATLVKQIREEAKLTGAQVLILSAGDINTGPPESNLFKASPDIEAMNQIGFRAMAVGNPEFDNPLELIRKQEKQAKFDFLSSNIVDENGKHAFKPFITTEMGGKKIAIIGFTTPDTPNMTPTAHSAGLTFLDPAEAAKDLVKKLKKENDLVIALSHLGFFPNENHGINSPGDITLAKRLPELDVIVGGHTHTELKEPVRVGDTLIVQAKESSRFMGRMDLDLSEAKPRMISYQLIPITNIPQDEAIKKILQPYLDEGAKKFSKIVGTALPGFAASSRAEIVKVEVPIGKFIAEAQKFGTKADIVLVNGAGLRTGITEGEISIRDLLNVSPFGNPLTSADLNGSEVWKFVETGIKEFKVPGNFPYFSDNVSVELDAENKVTKIFVNGQEVPNAPEGKFKVVANNYITEMVDDFAFFQRHPTFQHTGLIESETYIKYLEEKKTIRPEEFSQKSIIMPNCVQGALNTLITK